jgi:hypothetical protein
MVQALGSRHAEEAAGAREGLVSLGAEAAVPLLVGLEFGAPGRRDALVAVLAELEVGSAELERLYAHQLAALRRSAVLRGALGRAPAARLLARHLDERLRHGSGALLALVAMRSGDSRVADLERQLRRTRDERRRDVQIEALEALLGPAERRELLPLLDAAGGAPEAAAERLGLPLPSPAEAWRELRADADELTRRLARHAAPPAAAGGAALEEAAGIGNALGMRDPIELAARLSQVPVFDRLSTAQLVTLAQALAEERVEAGELVYAEGDEGSSLYVVLAGEIEISRGGAPLERVGPGRFFGELSTLDGVPRSVSARALAPAQLLRLSREDLLALMEEAPALGIGLAQHLALRVRELRERLRPGVAA